MICDLVTEILFSNVYSVDANERKERAVMMNENCDNGIPVPDYVDENVSNKVVKLIQSYTSVVNKMVWRKTEE